MRTRYAAFFLGALLVTACGSTPKTTVVAVPAGSTVVVPTDSSGETHVVTTH